MKRRFLATALLLFAAGAYAQGPRLIEEVQKKGDEIVIPYQKYVLENGLTVILTEDHSDPIVRVDVTYHVGSAREEIGKSGFAHFFEHMMFSGSDHVKNGEHIKTVTAVGGAMNGSTNQDRTNYFETVPSNQLEKMLWLESDRMGFLMDAVTQRKFEIQRSTVKNERGQNYDNRPYGLASEAVSKALFPYGHPYSWLTIGYVEDLNRVDVNDLKRFFLRWYGPNNATLTIGGDIDPKQTLAWVQKYFGSIPRCPEVKPTVLPAPELSSDRYISYQDNYAKLPMLSIAYPGVKMYDKDQAALDALSMFIGGGENSIFYKNFIKKGLALKADMSSQNSELAGIINIMVVPYPGHTLAEMQKQVNDCFAEFEKNGVSDEDLRRFKGQSEAETINGLESVSGKVSELAEAQTFTGTPNQIGRELADYRNVTKEDVMRVYNKYIKGKARVVLSVLPKGVNAPAGPDNFKIDTSNYKAPDYGYAGLTYHKAHDNFDRSIQPPSGPNPVVKVPPFWTYRAKNDVKIIGSYNKEIPSVSMIFSIKGGGLLAAKNPSKAGLPSIVADMLKEDTKDLSSEELSSKLDDLGSDISVSVSPGETYFSVTSLTKNVDETLNLLKQRLFHPKFTQSALDRIKNQHIQRLKVGKTEPGNVAFTVFSKLLYGRDNIRTYGLDGTEGTLKNITLADVQAYYDNYIAPNLCSVVVVGDLTEDAAKTKLSFLYDWKVKNVGVPDAPKPENPPAPKTIYFVDIPHAAQSVILTGYYTGVNFDGTGVYYKLGLANYMLGGGFSGRLNMDLREDKGWTYGISSQVTSTKDGGVFLVQTGVRTSSTDSAAMEIFKVIGNYANNGITADELDFTKHSIGQSDATKYETNIQKARFLWRIQEYALGADVVEKQSNILQHLSKTEVDDLAKKYFDPSKMTMLIVGDKSAIVPGLQNSGYNLVELDTDGNPK